MLGSMWLGNLWRFSDLIGERSFGLLDISVFFFFFWYLSSVYQSSSECQEAALALTDLLRVLPTQMGNHQRIIQSRYGQQKHSSQKGNRKAGGVHHPPKEKKLAFSRNSTSQVTEQSYFRFLIGIHRIEIARKFVQVQQ